MKNQEKPRNTKKNKEKTKNYQEKPRKPRTKMIFPDKGIGGVSKKVNFHNTLYTDKSLL